MDLLHTVNNSTQCIYSHRKGESAYPHNIQYYYENATEENIDVEMNSITKDDDINAMQIFTAELEGNDLVLKPLIEACKNFNLHENTLDHMILDTNLQEKVTVEPLYSKKPFEFDNDKYLYNSSILYSPPSSIYSSPSSPSSPVEIELDCIEIIVVSESENVKTKRSDLCNKAQNIIKETRVKKQNKRGRKPKKIEELEKKAEEDKSRTANNNLSSIRYRRKMAGIRQLFEEELERETKQFNLLSSKTRELEREIKYFKKILNLV